MRWPAAAMLPPEPDAVLDRFASLAAHTLDAPMAVLSLLDDRGHVVLPGASGLRAPRQHDRVSQWTRSVYRHVSAAEGVVAVDTVTGDPWSDDGLAAVDRAEVRSWIAAPLRFSSDFARVVDGTAAARGGTVAAGSVEQLRRDVHAVWQAVEPRRTRVDDPGSAPEGDRPGPGADGVDGPATVVWGVLCVMDTTTRHWDDRDRALVGDIAAAAAAELRSRVLTSRAVSAEARMSSLLETSAAVHARSQLLLDLSRGLSRAQTLTEVSSILAGLLRDLAGVVQFGLAVPDGHRGLRFVESAGLPTDGAAAPSTALALATRAVGEVRSFSWDDAAGVEALAPAPGSPGQGFPGAVVVVPVLAALTRAAPPPLGALVLGWATARDTSDRAERALWEAVADHTAQTMTRVQYAADRRSSAETLQRSMLTELPQPDRLELAARYVPAARGEDVGGDWYDAVTTTGGTTTVTIGDVAGHNMAAAAEMAQLRSMLRTLVHSFDETPAKLLDRLEAANQHLGVRALATAVLARVEPAPGRGVSEPAGSWWLRWSNAGHPPPVLLHPDGRTEVLARTPDVLFGLGPSADTGLARHDHRHPLPEGSVLLLFTDGLIEHRGRSLDEGVDALREVMTRHVGAPVPDLLDAVQAELIGDDPDDDCAVLVVRLAGAP